MNRTERMKLLAVLILEALLALVALALVAWNAHAQPAIALATDKEAYALDEKVVLLGRGYDFPERLITFYLYVDEISASGHIRNVLYQELIVKPPVWDFTIFWSPERSAHFSAYVTGPDHTASSEVQFQVVDQAPVPELHSTSPLLLVGLVIVFVTIATRRSRR